MTAAGSAAIVTGGGSGIGRATALELARRGRSLAVVDIDASAADAVAQQVVSGGGRAIAIGADVSDPDAVRRLFDTAAAQLDPARVLVNCAGILRLAPAVEVTPAEFDRVMTVNARSVFLTSTEFARRLIAAGQGGSIVNVSSVHAVISEPNAVAYTASKGAVEAMSRTLASEWARHGIRVNCVRPGAIWTAMSTPLYTPEVLAALAQRVPMRHPGQPEQVAFGIGYLASDEAEYVTGTTLAIDGGFIMDGGLPDAEYT